MNIFKKLVKMVLSRAVRATDSYREIVRLAEITQFLCFENSALRRIVRHLQSENPHYRDWIAQTGASFDYQWEKLHESENLLSNPEFMKTVCDLVCQYTGLPAAWFPGKRVLDAGCGNGRFSWALAKLGADVTSFDLSTHGVANLQRLANEANLPIHAFQHNVLKPLPLNAAFDLVWSFGVLHHTGNTFLGFQNIHPFVAPDGLLFLMLYGEPRLSESDDFAELNFYERLRRKTQNLDYAEKIKVLERDPEVDDIHGWFDAVSPFINDFYSFGEIESWLHGAGFENVKLTIESRNHHVMAQKSVKAQLPFVGSQVVRKIAS